jgi:hypothetical protein
MRPQCGLLVDRYHLLRSICAKSAAFVVATPPESRWRAWMRGNHEKLAIVLGLILPGTREVLFREVVSGTVRLLAFLTMVAIRITATGGGILAQIAMPVLNEDYFGEITHGGRADMTPPST